MSSLVPREATWLGDPASNLTVVVKSSKLCNLRCSYCYEFAELGDRRRIDSSTLHLLFVRVRELATAWNAKPKFCWHGGEPLLLGTDYYRRAIGMQEDLFGSHLTHLIQTNLYRVGSAELETIKLFDQVSISFDVFGKSRQTGGGRQSQASVVANMDLLRREGIGFGAISVLTAENISQLPQTFEFFVSAGLSFRILPYYREASSEQASRFGLPTAIVRNAYIWLIDQWMQWSRAVAVNPVEEYLEVALRVVTLSPKRWYYNKRRRDHVLMINTNGDVYAPGTAYNDFFKYGNVLANSADEIISSPGRRNAIERAEHLIELNCSSCPYYGYCSGYPVAEQTDVELKGQTGCGIARPAIDRTVEWLKTLPIAIEASSTQEDARVF